MAHLIQFPKMKCDNIIQICHSKLGAECYHWSCTFLTYAPLFNIQIEVAHPLAHTLKITMWQKNPNKKQSQVRHLTLFLILHTLLNIQTVAAYRLSLAHTLEKNDQNIFTTSLTKASFEAGSQQQYDQLSCTFACCRCQVSVRTDCEITHLSHRILRSFRSTHEQSVNLASHVNCCPNISTIKSENHCSKTSHTTHMHT